MGKMKKLCNTKIRENRMTMASSTRFSSSSTSSTIFCRNFSSKFRCFPKWNSVFSVVLILTLGVTLVSAEVNLHKHRQRHGNDQHHPRSRVRRVGRETDSNNTPLVQNYQSYRSEGRGITESNPPYSIQSEFDDPSSRSESEQNLHKPEFIDCSKDVSPSVPEGEPVNTTVFRIEATDRDPPASGGTITYSIVSGNENNDKFIIDPKTGVIRTNKVFDRDEPEREKEEYITIRATDNGRPQLDSVCTIKILITDINDGVPLFERFEYKESVPRDLGVGEVVMRISATDIDDRENGTVWYKLDSIAGKSNDLDFFQISETTGEVTLKKLIDSNTHKFELRAVATDRGRPPKSASTNLVINVIEPRTRPPVFNPHPESKRIPERGYDKSEPIMILTADSRSSDKLVFYELVNGQTEPTNKGGMFTIETSDNEALLKLDKDLDYETVSQYTLTVRASNKDNLASETTIRIFVDDANDEKPDFTEGTSGVVLENEDIGTSVMRVRAIDRDGTSPNRDVTYTLKDEDKENFEIDPNTGEIFTKKKFDREAKDVYQVTVVAKDGAPSALKNDGQPNSRPVTLKIEIADKNDNSPAFVKTLYEAEIAEDADINNKVIEVKAEDKDTASEIKYSITNGNIDDSFYIHSSKSGGLIHVKNQLDYEKIQEYSLTVQASDGLYDAFTHVKIRIININDEPPKFEKMSSVNTTIMEESVPVDCIFQLRAYDPDIGDRNAPQNIKFFINKGQENFGVDDRGCVRVTKPLDRDPPNGSPFTQIIVGAYDEGGLTPTKKEAYQVLQVNLNDINDNAPFYNGPNPVVWYENQPRGMITKLTADDYDTPENGPPFNFQLDASATTEIRNFFKIEGNALYANKDHFDREAKKEYLVPISISDSGTVPQTGTSTLTVVIGDVNDSPMFPGESKIFVYKYKGKSTSPIGRVYVEDEDDWDLPDKTFDWASGHPHTFFTLDSGNGDINMKPTAVADTYHLYFKVTDSKENNKEVAANVTVTVKEITDEAVDNSGSIRFMGITKENFIKPNGPNGKSKKDILHDELARIFAVPKENVDIFTVIDLSQSFDRNKVDVRYSVHNSPYWKAEKLDGKLAEYKDALETTLQLNIVMIRIDECISEKLHCESSCTNHLNKSEIPYRIATNTSSFVGVDAFVVPECTCSSNVQPTGCFPKNPCLHDGTCISEAGRDEFKCECGPGFDGPRCEKTSIALPGQAYAWYPPISVCSDSSLQVNFGTNYENGLILYNGPIFASPMGVTDFISIELKKGKPVLLMDYGTGVARVEVPDSSNLADGETHQITVSWSPLGISMRVDECLRNERTCWSGNIQPVGNNTQLNVNGPLQIGGLSFKPTNLQKSTRWTSVPTTEYFRGCIANLTFNGMYYDLGEPSHTFNMNVSGCDSRLLTGEIKITLGADWNFIIAILVSVIVLLLLIMAFLFYRKRRSYEEVKGEFNDDVRDNILHYSDEGGGEGDQTGYDLSVLMKASNGPPYINNAHMDKIAMDDLNRQGRAPEGGDGPDIQSFVQGNKNKIDNDPDGLPYDDVRNYAYEGDGNSMGSLSSLASGTDDEDLNFDFLPAFGPRFKKLADMYGGQSSDDESYTPPPEAWC